MYYSPESTSCHSNSGMKEKELTETFHLSVAKIENLLFIQRSIIKPIQENV